MVGEGVPVGALTISVRVNGSVSVIAGVNIEVGFVGAVAIGAHPAKAKAGIKKSNNKEDGFIIESFPIVLDL
jgi:hypothetical protein